MDIERIDLREASETTLREVYDLSVKLGDETRPEGDPISPFQHLLDRAKNLPDFLFAYHYLYRDPSGTPVAMGASNWQIAEDNQHLAWLGIDVLPEHRRRGIAKQILPRLVEDAEGAGRTMVNCGTDEIVPAGEAFCERVGAKAAYRDHTNRLLLSNLDRDMLTRWIAEGPTRASGYSLVVHDGPYGDKMMDAAIKMVELMNTAPREDLDMEDWKVTPEQLEAWEKMTFSVPNERWTIYARHDASGEWVGFTEMIWNPAKPRTTQQMGTAVDPTHRGHALGKWLKAAMLDRLLRERPDVLDVRTGNADSNDPMLGINKQLGFEPFRAHTGWQIPTEALRDYVNGSTS